MSLNNVGDMKIDIFIKVLHNEKLLGWYKFGAQAFPQM